MIEPFYAEHFGTYPSGLILAVVVIGVIAISTLIFVAVAKVLDRKLPDVEGTVEGGGGRRWLRLPPRIANHQGR